MKYIEIEFDAGSHLESAVQQLKSQGTNLVCGEFNSVMLYSDIDDLDSAYLKVTGKTKIQIDEDRQIAFDLYDEEVKSHKESIPELTREWRVKGATILDKEYLAYWSEIVPVRLHDIYRGRELGSCLEIVDKLNSGCELSEARSIMVDQNHSGMSASLVSYLVRSLCKRGEEFASYNK